MKIKLENAVVYQGSNLDVLPTLPDNSVDSIVTDPPYELGFMGKSWDNSGIAYSVELWTECMRVLKPGGHLLAFGGSRTWHRLAVAIEDAGFEMRDSIAWLYGSGFPKSMDISKQIDKAAPRAGMFEDFSQHFTKCWELSGMKRSDLFAYFAHYKNADSIMAQISNWKLGKNVPSKQDFEILKPLLGLSGKFDLLIDRVEAEREVIGSKSGTKSVDGGGHGIVPGGITESVKLDITAPATDEAKQWAGWGTALKPAFEPVVVARKPLEEKTVAANVLKFGTGGLNIDGSRIGFASEADQASATPQGKVTSNSMAGAAPDVEGGERKEIDRPDNSKGRWPANIILDPYTAELLDEQSGIGKSGKPGIRTADGFNSNAYGNGMGIKAGQENGEYGDSGGASRFFYVAKASKKDRNEGLDDLEGRAIGAKGNGLARTCATCGSSVLDGCDCPDRTFVNPTRANFHPTVKPTALMEYLIKLVTPPDGTVLDPFTGSGSTGKAALLSGFKFIGIELTEEYLPIIEGRLKWASQQVSKETNEVLF